MAIPLAYAIGELECLQASYLESHAKVLSRLETYHKEVEPESPQHQAGALTLQQTIPRTITMDDKIPSCNGIRRLPKGPKMSPYQVAVPTLDDLVPELPDNVLETSSELKTTTLLPSQEYLLPDDTSEHEFSRVNDPFPEEHNVPNQQKWKKGMRSIADLEGVNLEPLRTDEASMEAHPSIEEEPHARFSHKLQESWDFHPFEEDTEQFQHQAKLMRKFLESRQKKRHPAINNFGTAGFEFDWLDRRSSFDIRRIMGKILASLTFPDLPLRPLGKTRLVWDTVGMLLLLWDAVSVPLLLLVLDSDTISLKIDWTLLFYWTIDIVLSFFTATFKNGQMVMEKRIIVKTYLTTWFFPDLCMVLPDWIIMVLYYSLGSQVHKGDLSILKVLRIMRAMRLLRILKFESVVIKGQLKRFNSLMFLNAAQLVKMFSALSGVTHVIACMWYWIGYSTEDSWAQKRGFNDDVAHGYFVALHWSLGQLHGSVDVFPTNTSERIFAVSILLCGMLIFSAFVSVITDMILQVRDHRKKKMTLKQNVNEYMYRWNVSSEVAVSAKQYLDWHLEGVGANEHRDTETLKMLPVPLQKRILIEARGSTLRFHPLLAYAEVENWVVFRDICYKVTSHVCFTARQAVFCIEDPCVHASFIFKGNLRYVRCGKRSQRLGGGDGFGNSGQMIRQVMHLRVGTKISKGGWVAEPALWLNVWQNRGDLYATDDTTTLQLNRNELADLVRGFPHAFFDFVYYARLALADMDAFMDDRAVDDLWSLGIASKMKTGSSSTSLCPRPSTSSARTSTAGSLVGGGFLE